MADIDSCEALRIIDGVAGKEIGKNRYGFSTGLFFFQEVTLRTNYLQNLNLNMRLESERRSRTVLGDLTSGRLRDDELEKRLEFYDLYSDGEDNSGKLHTGCECFICGAGYSKVGRDYQICSDCLNVYTNEFRDRELAQLEEENRVSLQVYVTREGI
jgi:hypothetical protein